MNDYGNFTMGNIDHRVNTTNNSNGSLENNVVANNHSTVTFKEATVSSGTSPDHEANEQSRNKLMSFGALSVNNEVDPLAGAQIDNVGPSMLDKLPMSESHGNTADS